MKADPGSFYLGVIDVFSIMLPGALLAYFLPELVDMSALGRLFQQPGEKAHEWLVFLLPAYLFGHLAFLLSSFLDIPYDKTIRPYYYPEAGELSYIAAEVIKAKSIGEENVRAINTFQWAKAMLLLEKPEASAEIARLEAASKFFRSLVVVFALLALLNIVALLRNSWEGGTCYAILVFSILMVLSLWRYAERRHKSVKQACWFVITRDGIIDPKACSAEIESRPTHAGGVVYRKRGNTVEYLTVRPKKNLREWLLPKGRIEYGETPAETAVREVQEETGVDANVVASIGTTRFSTKREGVVAEFFLMEFRNTIGMAEQREPEWWLCKDAIWRLSFANYRYLLALADKIRVEIEIQGKQAKKN